MVYNCHNNITVMGRTMKNSFRVAADVFRENNGILRWSTATSLGINAKTLSDMVEAGLLVREARGLYRLADMEPPSHQDMVYVCQRVPDAVICLISALSFYELTTQIPFSVYIALPRAEKRVRPKIDYPPINVVWLTEKPYRAGIENKTVDGFNIRIYSREKTVADCFKFRNKIGTDVAVEALKEYVRSGKRDIPRLVECARVDRVESVMLPYLEALA